MEHIFMRASHFFENGKWWNARAEFADIVLRISGEHAFIVIQYSERQYLIKHDTA